MELKRALELRGEYSGSVGSIHIDKDGYVCLNDLASYFPSKDMDSWLRTSHTQELVSYVEKKYGLDAHRGIVGRRGGGGGTFAHPIIAVEFLAWLSAEFKLEMYEAYVDGTRLDGIWDIQYILSSSGYVLKIDTK